MADAPKDRSANSPLKDGIRAFWRNKPAMASLCMIVLLAFAAISGALYCGKKADANELIRMEEAALVGDNYKTEAQKTAALDPIKTELKDTFLPPFTVSNADPEKTYWMGTDELGRDVLARLWAGSSISLTIGFLAVGISVLLGISLGGISGYFGRNRVGLPMFATLLLALTWGILSFAEQYGAAFIVAVFALVLFGLQFMVALITTHWRTSLFFVVALLLFALTALHNRSIETDTPEGAQLQEALQTYNKARELLLKLRDYGREVKAYEEEDKKHVDNIAKGEGLPEWMYAGQFQVEVEFKLLDLRVARFEIEKYRSANRTALRLHGEQQERADHIEKFVEDYEARFKEASEDEKQAMAERDALFKQGDKDGGRKKAEEAANHGARAKTFDPAELKKRVAKLRATGIAREKYAQKLSESIEPLLEKRIAAHKDAEAALTALLEDKVNSAASLRGGQFKLEAAMRAFKKAEADFKVGDAKRRAAAAKEVVEAIGNAKADDPIKHEAVLKELQAEWTAQEGAKQAAENEQYAAKDAQDKLEKIMKDPEPDAKKALPPFKVQGSNDLVDRRGKMRPAFVIKYDTEYKNRRTDLRVAEELNGHYRYGLYRVTSHFLTKTTMYLILAVAALAVMAAAQAGVHDKRGLLSMPFLPTITVDDLVMRFTEIMMTIPVIFLILAILAAFDKDVFITMGVIGLTSWMATTRFVRAEILSLREQDFIQAARALGVSDFRIIWRHLVPNAISPVLVSASIGVAGAVLAESTLSFLGIGAKPEQTTWGMILSDGRQFIFDAPWLTWIPGIAILITVLSFNLLGEGLREAFNPKLRGR